MNRYDIIALIIVIASPIILGISVLLIGNTLSNFADKVKGSD